MKCDIAAICRELKRLWDKISGVDQRVVTLEERDNLVVAPPLSGSGTADDPLTVTGDIGGDDWGTQVVQHDTTLSGNGTSGSPLSVVASGAGDDWGAQMVEHNDTLSGDGTSGNELAVFFSADANNAATAGADGGVYVPAAVGGTPPQVSQAEYQTYIDSAITGTRVWSPLDAISLVDYRTGFRVVKDEAELDLALIDASATTIKIDGTLDITGTKLLANTRTIMGDGRSDGVRVTGDFTAFEVRASGVRIFGLAITSTVNTQGRAIEIARNAANSGVVIENCWIHDIGEGIYAGGSGAAARIGVVIQNNRIENILKPRVSINDGLGFAIYLIHQLDADIIGNYIENTIGNSIYVGDPGSRCLIANNRCFDSTRSGIEAFFVDECIIASNHVANHFTIGVSFVPILRGVCGNNIIEDIGDIGIEAFAQAGTLGFGAVAGNLVKGVAYGQFTTAIPCLGLSIEHWKDGSYLTISANTVQQVAEHGGVGSYIAAQTQDCDSGVKITANAFIVQSSRFLAINNSSEKIVFTNNSITTPGGVATGTIFAGGSHVIRNNDISLNGGAGYFENFVAANPLYIDHGAAIVVGVAQFVGDNTVIP